MPTRLLLLRHARSTWNAENRWQGRADPPLDEIGLSQAARLAAHLRARGDKLSALYTSPLLRAAQTAAAVGTAYGLTPIHDERLMETNVGSFQGLTGPEVRERFPAWWEAHHSGRNMAPLPDGELHTALTARVVGAIEEFATRHPDEHIGIVSHGGALAAYLMHLLGVPAEWHPPFSFGNASLTIVELQPHTPRLLLLNDRCHLV